MKITANASRFVVALATTGVLFGTFVVVRTQQNPYRLKSIDQRKMCLECHSDFQDTLKKRFVHSAVQSGECAACHSPHTSSHGKLLSVGEGQICASCHDGIVPANARSTHDVVVKGECAKCHDPHASDHPSNLLAKGNDLCTGCHKTLGAAIVAAKFKHSPVEQGCLTCHNAHASDRAVSLLKAAATELCLKCHKPDTQAFVTRHSRYPVAKASCTTCHDPHGSNQPALLLDSVHPPVSAGTCAQCHAAPDSPTPFAVKSPGYELCKGCHNEMVTTTLAKNRLHWPIADRESCSNCHNPHASKHAKLLKTDTQALCSTCHADTTRRMQAVAVKHAPVEAGECVSCHSPHASAGVFLVDQPSVVELCATCHDYSQHSSHPLGDKAVDPRNKNLRVDCLSCHSGHGTDHKKMLLAATNVELCTPCHKQYSR